MPVQERWVEPPTTVDADAVKPQAVRGAQAILMRAALLAVHDATWGETLAPTLSHGARKLLRAAPAAEDWVPVEDVRSLLSAVDPSEMAVIQGAVARLVADQAAGHLEWSPLEEPLLSGDSPGDLLAAIPSIYAAYFQGGSGHLDAHEGCEAWVSLWVEDLWPRWASHEATAWFKRALEDAYRVRASVAYLPPPADRPWWHRYHLSWS